MYYFLRRKDTSISKKTPTLSVEKPLNLDKLHIDLLVYLLSFLDSKSLGRTAQVSKRLLFGVKDDWLAPIFTPQLQKMQQNTFDRLKLHSGLENARLWQATFFSAPKVRDRQQLDRVRNTIATLDDTVSNTNLLNNLGAAIRNFFEYLRTSVWNQPLVYFGLVILFAIAAAPLILLYIEKYAPKIGCAIKAGRMRQHFRPRHEIESFVADCLKQAEMPIENRSIYDFLGTLITIASVGIIGALLVTQLTLNSFGRKKRIEERVADFEQVMRGSRPPDADNEANHEASATRRLG